MIRQDDLAMTNVSQEENWIIRWMLWHAFRYRDQRNNRNRGVSAQGGDHWGDDDESSASPDHRAEGSCGKSRSARAPSSYTDNLATASRSSTKRNAYWDPVRNMWTMYP